MDTCKKLLQQNCKTCANNLGVCIGGNYGTRIPENEKLTDFCMFWSCNNKFFKAVECDGQCSMR
jgi:hypothetical protein